MKKEFNLSNYLISWEKFKAIKREKGVDYYVIPRVYVVEFIELLKEEIKTHPLSLCISECFYYIDKLAGDKLI